MRGSLHALMIPKSASIAINTYSNNLEVSPVMIAAPQQTWCTTVISLDTHPFFLNSGASIHVSPEQLDFLSLRPISARAIKSVGGSSIMATGIGNIKLCIVWGAYLLLLGVLFVPNSTVHLISISSLTCWRVWYLLWGEKGKCEQIWNKPKPTNTNTKSNTNQKYKSHVLIVWGGDSGVCTE